MSVAYNLSTPCRDCGAEFTTVNCEPRYAVCPDCRARMRLNVAAVGAGGPFCELIDEILDAYEFALGYYSSDEARRQAKLNVQSKLDERIDESLARWPVGAADGLLWEEEEV